MSVGARLVHGRGQFVPFSITRCAAGACAAGRAGARSIWCPAGRTPMCHWVVRTPPLVGLERKTSVRQMQIVDARRVLSADRRGSSWPVIVDADGGPWFTKLRGAGQGTAALVAEVIVAELAEALGLSVPARALVRAQPNIESLDRDGELRALLDASAGINLGFAFLAGASEVGPSQIDLVSRDDAAAIVWLDGLVMNPDRTARNPNLLWWRNRLWLVDHGASLGFQYQWSSVTEDSTGLPTPGTEPHLLIDRATDLAEWDEIFAARLTREVVEAAVDEVPDEFLRPLLREADHGGDEALRRRRAAYVAFVWKRLKAPRSWVGAPPPQQGRARTGPPSWVRDRRR